MENNTKIVTIFAQTLVLLDIFDDNETSNLCEEQLEKYLSVMIGLVKKTILRLKNYVEEVVSLYNDELFKSHFRMRRSTFNYVVQLISPSITRLKSGHKTLSPEKQLLIAIWKMATPDSYRSICEKFDIAKASALKAVRRVTKAIANLSPLFITWPNEAKIENIYKGFAAVSAFPKVIGAIDGTHINIKAPHINAECYINRKGHHSIQLQAVCDHERKFLHCLAGHVGSVHDQRVFRLSEIYQYLQDATKFPNNSHLVGDAAYTLHNHLMTPFRDNGHLTERQKNFNFCHSSARIVIERAFGLLKGRFRSLLTVLDMERVDLIPEFIIACCVLHNICLLQNDDFLSVELDVENETIEVINRRNDNNTGHMKRDMICNTLIMRNA